MKTVYLGLGSNLQDPPSQLRLAVKAILEHPAIVFQQCSSLYESLPLGPSDQPSFFNIVLKIDTALTPMELLAWTAAIEIAQGRVRHAERWGPRCIDIDILLYGNDVICTERLVIPHPGLKVREFVVIPLLEIAPGLCLPSGERLFDSKETCRQSRLGLSKCPWSMDDV